MFSKNLFLVILIEFFNCNPAFLQNIQSEVLTLKAEQISLPNRKFYIQRIICDVNQPKYFLIRKGLFNRQKNLILGDSIQHVLLRYLKLSNKYIGGLAPVLMRVKELKVREERHFLKEFGYTKISVEFYIETDYKPIKIFQSNAFRTYSGLFNITSQHEENIRDVIKSCMMDFNNAKVDFSKYVIPKVFKAKHTPY
jgi:hypothetical protein